MATYELLEDRAASFRVLVSGLENWIDAGGAARRAVSILAGGAPDGEAPAPPGAGERRPSGGEATRGDAGGDEGAPHQPGLLHIAAFDADDLVDHQARRPTMQLVDGVNVGVTCLGSICTRPATPTASRSCCCRAPSPTTAGGRSRPTSWTSPGASTWSWW